MKQRSRIWSRAMLCTAIVSAFLLPIGVIESSAQVQSESHIQSAPSEVQRQAAFQAFLKDIEARAVAEGVRKETSQRILPTLTFNQRVVNLDRAQPDDSNAAPPLLSNYLARRLDSARINSGRDRYQRLRPRLQEIENQYGVPAGIMLGIWGMETNYGSYMGNFDLFRSLASLAYDGRRRDLFSKELIAALKIVDQGYATRDMMVGSWAGAMGHPQFLPSSYLASAVDGDGDGRIDIWRSEADALASIANYLKRAGWKQGEPWGLEVRVPSNLDRAAIANTVVAPSCARVHARHSRWLTIAEWKKKGLSIAGGAWPDDNLKATLIEADGEGGRSFLTFDNYRALLNYNCSNYYAISVGLLGDAVAR